MKKSGQCKNLKIFTLNFFLKRKKAQMKLSFGMIFSIILIIIFIAFAFYAILKFLDIQDSVKIAQFTDDLQSDIDKAWRGSGEYSQQFKYSLPQKIDSICFVNDEYENLVFHSDELLGGEKIEHLDIEQTLDGKNSFCVDNIEGKIRMTIKKEYGDALVTIENEE